MNAMTRPGAGRVLNALVMQRVLHEEPRWEDGVPDYSGDIAQAWRVVEHLRRDGWLVTIKAMPDGFPFELNDTFAGEPSRPLLRRAVCELEHMPSRDRSDEESLRLLWRHPCAAGDSVPEAVCKAALAAVEP